MTTLSFKASAVYKKKPAGTLIPADLDCWPLGLVGLLREDLDDDAAVLRTAGLGVVRRNRLLFAVADHVDLVQRNLVVLIQIALHGFGAGQAQLLVVDLVAGVVGVAFDLDPHVLL